MGPTKRASIIAASVIALIAAIVLSFMASGKDYQPLLTNIPSEQVSMLVDKLNKINGEIVFNPKKQEGLDDEK
jgi:flagellar M-ring protein FliF